ncbi:hypothetical protein REPUB_Repub20aG0098700 [Reevesia pubescens]
MEEVTSNTLEALINHLFDDDDLLDTNIPMITAPILLPEEPIQVQCFPTHQDENGTNHKSATNYMKPGKIAAYRQQECRPWLKQKPFGDQNSGNEGAKQKPKLQPPEMKDSASTTLYQQVMAEVANKTRGSFLKHYGDDSVHVQFQELWKLKMKNKKVKLGRLAGKIPPAGVATPSHDLNPPYERREECGSGSWTFTQKKDPPPEPLQTTTSISLPGESIQFQCLPANYKDGKGTNSKSEAYRKLGKTGSCKQQPSRPWFRNSGSEGAKPKIFKPRVRHPAKKQQVHRPWLKEKPFDNQDNAAGKFWYPEDLFVSEYLKETLKNNAVKKLDLDSISYPT